MLLIHILHKVSSVHSLRSCPTLRPHEPQHARSPCPPPTPGVHPNPCSLSQWSHPTISSSCPLLLPSIFPSIRVFSNESALYIRWPKYWSFSFKISPTNEHPGLISFRMDWLDLLVVQGTLKSLLQHHSLKASILWRSAFIIVQLSHPYMTTGKTIALTRRTFVDKVMSLLFNLLYRLMIFFFLPRSTCVLIYINCCCLVTKSCPILLQPPVVHQAAQSMGFPREENWSGLTFPPSGNLCNPGIECASPALQENSLPLVSPVKP